MQSIWSINSDDYFEVVKRAKANGKKAGDSMEEEFLEYMAEKGQKPIGNTELTKTELIKEYTSHNKKILDISIDNKGITEYKTYEKIDNE